MVKPEILYDVVAQFTVGNLVYKSWGGGLVTVSAANDRDSVIEIPATVKYKGMDYRIDELEDSAFAAHPFLKRVVMPDNPKLHVMKHIFAGSPNLEGIYFRSKTPPMLGNAIWRVTMDDIFETPSLGRLFSMFLRVAKMLIAVHRGGTLLILWSLRNDNDKIKMALPGFEGMPFLC